MKRTWKILSLLLVALLVMSLVVSCGGGGGGGNNNDDPGTGDGETPGGGDNPGGNEGTKLPVNVNNITIRAGDYTITRDENGFVSLSTPYDGEPHRLARENINGIPNPSNASVRCDFYLGDVKLASYTRDGKFIEGSGDAKYAEGVTEAGTYDVKIVYSAADRTDGIVEFEFIITNSYNIVYTVGQPTGSDVPEMIPPENGNPDVFTETTRNQQLFNPSMSSDTLGYNFRGWYTDAACENKITVINGKDIDPALYASGTLTLYAKFEACVAYPPLATKDPTSEEDGRVETAPTTIPAIPNYDSMPADSFKLLDMSLLSENGSGMGYGYTTTKGGVYIYSKAPSIMAEDGNYVIQWQDVNDLDDGPIAGSSEGHMHVPGDDMYGSMMTFASPLSGFMHTEYNTIEFWIYNANNVGNVFTMLVFVDGNDQKSMSYDITLDFSGWKKFSLHVSDFKTSSGAGSLNISKINFYGEDAGSLIPADNATLCLDEKPNFVYFSDFFLVNRTSEYTSNSPNGMIHESSHMYKVLDNLSAMSTYSLISDDEVASILDMLADNSESDTGSYFLDLQASDSYNIMSFYERLAQLASAWNDRSSDYYRSSTLLDVIAGGLNYMVPTMSDIVNSKVPTDDYFEDAAYYTVKTTNIIASYINEQHAESWMVHVNYFVNTPMGDGDRLIKTAFTYTSAHAALFDSREFQAGVRTIVSALNTNRITMAMNAADLTDAMTIISSINDTTYVPRNMETLVSSIYDWFYYNVDAFLTNGTVPAELESVVAIPLDVYIRAMCTIYDLAPANAQNKFASAVKYYIEQDASLADAIAENATYAKEMAGFTAIQENTTPAASPAAIGAFTHIYENIGQIFSKDADGNIILIDRVGTVIGVDDMPTLNCDRIYCKEINGVLAMNAGGRAIFIKNGVVVKNEFFGSENPNSVYNDNGNLVVITAGELASYPANTEAGQLFRISGAPVIVGISTDTTTGAITLKVYNYMRSAVDISFIFNGAYTGEISSLCSISQSVVNNQTTVTLKLAYTGGNVRPTTETYFEITITPKA